MTAELKMCILLHKHPEGLFGSELLHLSKGYLKRGTVYPTLQRLESKQHVSMEGVAAADESRRDRPKYKLTKEGQLHLNKFLSEMGLRII